MKYLLKFHTTNIDELILLKVNILNQHWNSTEMDMKKKSREGEQ